uniref:Uncharacterized protein n=1 Tax=Octactis speculum TaxID=3111310 RepID=A0A7S2DKP4_9STRA|mmetsp:Transcript_5033/g.6112  ORF Transcript_5033/g.6112 Transcript_5033/m.6112 type:complete len:298 (+) Transcript_5033:42-935(+)
MVAPCLPPSFFQTDTLMREHGVSDDAALAAIAWASRAPQEMLSPFSGAAKFNYINGPITNEENDDADEGDFSLDMLSTLPLEEKLLTVLKRSGVISYHLIRDLVVNTERSANGSKTKENLDGEGGGSHDWSDDDIVAALDEVAVLVNGAMWVVRSYHVLEDKVLIDCRDLIISVLRSEGSIIRQALTAVVTSDALDLEEERAPEVEEILESLACIDRQTRSWKLRLPPGNFHESSGLVNATDKLPAAMVNMARHEALQWEVRNMELQPLLDIYYTELGAVTASRRKKTRPPRCLSRN